MGSLAARRVSGWRTALRLGRVSNLPTVWSNVVAASALAGGMPLRSLALISGAMSLLYVGGMVLNDAFDARWDARQRPDRPIPAGEVSARGAFAAGFALIGAGVLLIGAIDACAGAAGLVLAAAILLYDWHHKGNPLSPLLMGLCRGLVYVTVALAAVGAVPPVIWAAAAASLAYVAALTYAARLEASDGIGSPLPLVLLGAPAAVALPQLALTVSALAAFAALIACAFAVTQLLMRRLSGDVMRAIALLIAAIAVNDALFAATTADVYAPFACLACFGLTLLLQRYVPAS
jgi:4-hydroxybenzoate polyprenyltransferase